MDSGETSRTQAGVTLQGTLRAWLILARASNLPTVWSNCVAAYWLGGWGSSATLLILCIAASLLYTGGMFLNDVCDVVFDRQYKPERPIIGGRVRRHVVATAALGLLLAGVSLLAAISIRTLLFGAVLALVIVTYDLVHKRISWAPVLMAACRFLLYMTAASAGHAGVTPRALGFATGLGLYIIGLSYLARGETRAIGTSVHWLVMLFAPVIVGLALNFSTLTVLCSMPLLFWILYGRTIAEEHVGRAVAILLAGIVLVDLLAVSPFSFLPWLGFIALFGAALLFQRYVPAT
jgi:UbiA prenyltransferase family protein